MVASIDRGTSHFAVLRQAPKSHSLSRYVIVHYVTRNQVVSYSAENDVFRTSRSGVRGVDEYEKHHPRPSTRLALSCTRYFMQGKDIFRFISEVFGIKLANRDA